MKKAVTCIILLSVVTAGLFMFFNPTAWLFAPRNDHEPVATTPIATTTNQGGASNSASSVQTVAKNLSVPWGLSFLPNDNLLVTERSGQLLELSRNGDLISKQKISSVEPRGEGGLLGLALHPDFSDNRQLYFYETYESDRGTRNRVVRYRYEAGELSRQAVIIDGIPGARYHDGGRISFDPSGQYLFITTGDAGKPKQSQVTNTLNGKVLRLNPDGSIPGSNPFDNAIYSYGHRNPQGLSWDQSGRLWSTEHGRSSLKSGLDEVNLIKAGANYGWPYLEGDETCTNDAVYDPTLPDLLDDSCNMRSPVVHSGPDITWAPASAAIADSKLFFGGLRGQAIYTAPIQTGVELRLGEITAYFKEAFGRVRTVKVGPDGKSLYVTTSNTDGRGTPKEEDDRIIRIKLSEFTR